MIPDFYARVTNHFHLSAGCNRRSIRLASEYSSLLWTRDYANTKWHGFGAALGRYDGYFTTLYKVVKIRCLYDQYNDNDFECCVTEERA